jgi:hypothetical protein
MAQTSTINNLYREYGVTRATAAVGGEVVMTGDTHEIVFDLDLTDLTESESVVIDTVFIPSGVRIKEIEVFTETAAATGVAIDLGMIRRDRSTELDYNGFLAAFATASMNADGERTILTLGSSTVGALVGTTLANDGLITCSRTTATAFTAGALKVYIRYYTP